MTAGGEEGFAAEPGAIISTSASPALGRKCNLRHFADYDHLHAYMRRLHSLPEIAATFDANHAKRHYYESHRRINPTGIVPIGPAAFV